MSSPAENGKRKGTPYIPSYMDLSNGPEPCVVCGDAATGYHYRCMTCEGCKGFFRRTIQKELSYQCKWNNSCEIDKTTRNQCQQCRFVKCINVGMATDLVLNEKQRKAKRKLIEDNRERRKDESTNSSSNFGSSLKSRDTGTREIQTLSDDDKQLISRIVSAYDHTSATIYSNFSIPDCMKDDENSVIVDPEIWYQLARVMTPSIMKVVEFAKGIPNFVELNVEDQILLLKSCCMEVMCLRTACKYDPQLEQLALHNGLKIQRQQSLNGWATLSSLIDPIFEFAVGLSKLKLDSTEIALLAAVLLMQSDRSGLKDPESVEKLQDAVLGAYKRYIAVKRPEQPVHWAKILMKVTDLRTISTRYAERVLCIKLDSYKDIPPLFLQMFHDGNDIVDGSRDRMSAPKLQESVQGNPSQSAYRLSNDSSSPSNSNSSSTITDYHAVTAYNICSASEFSHVINNDEIPSRCRFISPISQSINNGPIYVNATSVGSQDCIPVSGNRHYPPTLANQFSTDNHTQTHCTYSSVLGKRPSSMLNGESNSPTKRLSTAVCATRSSPQYSSYTHEYGQQLSYIACTSENVYPAYDSSIQPSKPNDGVSFSYSRINTPILAGPKDFPRISYVESSLFNHKDSFTDETSPSDDGLCLSSSKKNRGILPSEGILHDNYGSHYPITDKPHLINNHVPTSPDIFHKHNMPIANGQIKMNAAVNCATNQINNDAIDTPRPNGSSSSSLMLGESVEHENLDSSTLNETVPFLSRNINARSTGEKAQVNDINHLTKGISSRGCHTASWPLTSYANDKIASGGCAPKARGACPYDSHYSHPPRLVSSDATLSANI